MLPSPCRHISCHGLPLQMRDRNLWPTGHNVQGSPWELHMRAVVELLHFTRACTGEHPSPSPFPHVHGCRLERLLGFCQMAGCSPRSMVVLVPANVVGAVQRLEMALFLPRSVRKPCEGRGCSTGHMLLMQVVPSSSSLASPLGQHLYKKTPQVPKMSVAASWSLWLWP